MNGGKLGEKARRLARVGNLRCVVGGGGDHEDVPGLTIVDLSRGEEEVGKTHEGGAWGLVR